MPLCIFLSSKHILLLLRYLFCQGFSEAKIQKVLTAAYKIKNPFQVMTGSQFLETRKEMIKITTGVKYVNDRLPLVPLPP